MTADLRWDVKFAEGSEAETWLKETIGGGATIEVKRSKVLDFCDGPYVEFECLHADGVWHKSGIATTEAAFWFFKFGNCAGGWLVETQWLRRAARRAFMNESQRRQLVEGSHPTKGVIVTMTDLSATRES